MSRIVALDFGLKRTGIAVTDPDRIIATGLTTVRTHDLIFFLKDYFEKEKVKEIIVGLPLQMNNKESDTESHIKIFLKKFSKNFPNIKIHRIDERFTSILAHRTMLASGLKKQKRQNKELVDEISATIILQTYLNKPLIK